MAVSAPTDSFLPAELTASSFTLQNDHSLFTILRKNIYSDTILAPIRELSTNAIDACIEGNLDVNWSVHVPTIDEPYFEVRDYGPGMTIDFLEGDFTVVGASSKRTSNKTNGQFGLGRLSPLAYTSSFTLDSYNNGMHYSYLVSIKDGIPCALQLQAVPSSEPSGCKFSFVVEPIDISKFHKKAANLYKYFDYKPTTNIDLPEVRIHLDADFCMLTDDPSGVVMANVYYPLDQSHVNTQYSNVILKVPTGSVALTPGRESLNYDPATVTYLQEFVKDAEAELIDLSNAEIAAQPTKFAAGSLYFKLRSNTPWRLKDKLIPPAGISTTQKLPIAFTDTEVVFKVRAYKNTREISKAWVNEDWFYSAQYLIVDQRSFSHCFDELGDDVVVFKTTDVQSVVNQLTAFGITNYNLASEFDMPERQARTVRAPSLNMRKVGSSGNYTYDVSMGTIYYIPFIGAYPELSITESHLMQLVSNLGYDFTLYGIAKSNLSKIKDDDNFINFYDFLKDEFENRTLLLPIVDQTIINTFKWFNVHTIEHIANAQVAPSHIVECAQYYQKVKHLINNPIKAESLTALEPYITVKDWPITSQLPFATLLIQYPLLDEFRYSKAATIKHYLKLEACLENSTCPPN